MLYGQQRLPLGQNFMNFNFQLKRNDQKVIRKFHTIYVNSINRVNLIINIYSMQVVSKMIKSGSISNNVESVSAPQDPKVNILPSPNVQFNVLPNVLYSLHDVQQKQIQRFQSSLRASRTRFSNLSAYTQQNRQTQPQQFHNQQQIPQIQAPIQQSNVSQSGVYGVTRVPDQPRGQNLVVYNDDEPFKESVKSGGQQGKIDVKLIAQRTQVKLGQVTVLPAMCQVVSSGGTRTSVDLICVIDVSGSMSGEKIQLLKQTMKFLIETLTPSDRLSIITFQSVGNRICPLKAVTQENLVAFSSYINNLNANGGTSIMSGMNLALKTIRDRKIPNKVTSIFLLSDGQDGGAENQLKHALSREENKDLGIFSIHSFGFGNDHDENLMNKICTMKDGAFYFIQQLSTLDEAFCNALGGIISLVASEIDISVKNVAQGMVEGVNISKVFGDKWSKVNQGQYKIKLTQMMSQISKELVFELTIPAIAGQIGDIVREHVVMEVNLNAKGMEGKQILGAGTLSLTLINAHEQIAEVNENIEVIENYLRVKAAQVIQESMQKAQINQFEKAQKGIETMIKSIQSNNKARKEKMQTLLKDLQLIKQKCSRHSYESEGSKLMMSAQTAHINKCSLQYSSPTQTQMVSRRRQSKSSYTIY